MTGGHSPNSKIMQLRGHKTFSRAKDPSRLENHAIVRGGSPSCGAIAEQRTHHGGVDGHLCRRSSPPKTQNTPRNEWGDITCLYTKIHIIASKEQELQVHGHAQHSDHNVPLLTVINTSLHMSR